MEGLKAKVSADYLDAFKNRNTIKKNLLGVIKGEIQTKEKLSGASELSDADVLSIINKSYKNITETLSKIGENAELQEEAKVLEAYLPKQMSIEEISAALVEIVNETGATSAKDTGKIMGVFNKKFPGQFNGKDVSASVNKYFNA